MTPEERASARGSATICFMDGDELHCLWTGPGQSCSLLAVVIFDTTDQHWHLMGRVRVHLDDKLFDSQDKRHPIHFLFPPKDGAPMPVEEMISMADHVLRSAVGRGYGITKVTQVRRKITDASELQGLLREVEQLDPGFMSECRNQHGEPKA